MKPIQLDSFMGSAGLDGLALINIMPSDERTLGMLFLSASFPSPHYGFFALFHVETLSLTKFLISERTIQKFNVRKWSLSLQKVKKNPQNRMKFKP